MVQKFNFYDYVFYPFPTSMTACELFETPGGEGTDGGIAALFANTQSSSSHMIASMCQNFSIPMIQSTPNFAPTR